MSFLKKTLASFGIGSANVDAVLQHEVLYPGDVAKVTIHVYGGKTAQLVENIEVRLYCRYIDEETANGASEGSDRTQRVHRRYTLASWSLPQSFTIEHGETRDFELDIEIPWNTPITIGDTKVWLETGLDISMAKDPTDKDMLTIRPDPLLDAIFSEFEEQGLRIRQVECEAVEGFAMPFAQEFEFVPTAGPFHGRWREVEIVVYREQDSLQLWFEVDRNLRGVGGMLGSMLGKGQLKRTMTLDTNTEPTEAAKKVLEFLDTSC
ncbi:sporulation protein [Vibrio sp. RC27]